MQYYGTRLSENISRREPEGYLLCLNVPVARTGTQEYLPEELGLPPGSSLVPVSRTETEVFSPETVASFEGMPVTNDHPPDGVTVENIRALQKGHAHNVRRGSGEESDLLLADLIITDPGLIEAILGGKREISCGYTYELYEENGTYYQRKIRGNHVAVVDAGRAGHRVSIKDHKATISERRKHPMKKSLSKILARMAKDGDIETVAGIIEEMLEPESAAEEVAEAVAETVPAVAAAVAAAGAAGEADEPAAVVETPEATVVVDEAVLGEVISRLDQIISLLTPAPVADGEATATAGGGNLAGAEVNRNKRSPQCGAAPIEVAFDPAEEIAEAVEEVVEAAAAEEEPGHGEGISVEEISELVGEILDPGASEVIGEEDECDPGQEVIPAGDALRAALRAVSPYLAKLPKKQRCRV